MVKGKKQFKRNPSPAERLRNLGKVLQAPGSNAAGKQVKASASASASLLSTQVALFGFIMPDGKFYKKEKLAEAILPFLLRNGKDETKRAVVAATTLLLLRSGARRAPTTTGSSP